MYHCIVEPDGVTTPTPTRTRLHVTQESPQLADEQLALRKAEAKREAYITEK